MWLSKALFGLTAPKPVLELLIGRAGSQPAAGAPAGTVSTSARPTATRIHGRRDISTQEKRARPPKRAPPPASFETHAPCVASRSARGARSLCCSLRGADGRR